MSRSPTIASPAAGLDPVQRVLTAIAFGCGYYLLGVVGTVVSVPPTGFAVIWPATALLTGVLLLTSPRYWWIYLLGLAPSHLHMLQAFGRVPFAVGLTQVFGNFGLAALTAFTVRRVSPATLRFESFHSIVWYVIVAGVLIPGAFNSVTLGIHMLTGWTSDFWLSWRQWLLASIFPSVTITPLVVLIFQGRFLTETSRASRAQLVVLCLALAGLSLVVFGADFGAAYWPTLLLTPIPLLLWAAIRWGVSGACLSLICFAGAILARALTGAGPFATGASAISVLSLQVFLTATAIPLMIVAGLIEERNRSKALLHRSEQRIELAAASTDTGLWQWDAAERRLWTTEHCRAMFKLGPEEIHCPEVFLKAIHPEDRPRVQAALSSALSAENVDSLSEFRLMRGEEVRWFVLRTHAQVDEGEKIGRISGVFRDITPWVLARKQTELLSSRLLTLQEDERRQIAGELHDATTQHIAAVSLSIHALRQTSKWKPEVTRLFDDIQSSLATASQELRVFTYLLRPPELGRLGLRKVLTRYAEGFGRRAGLRIGMRLTGQIDALPVEHQRAVFRIIQESLANVHRHANATRANILISVGADGLQLIVADDGKGFSGAVGDPLEDMAQLGVGLPGMASRVRQLGGDIDLRGRTKGGAVIRVTLPIASQSLTGRPLADAA